MVIEQEHINVCWYVKVCSSKHCYSGPDIELLSFHANDLWAVLGHYHSMSISTGQYWAITPPCKQILDSTGTLPLQANQYWAVLGHITTLCQAVLGSTRQYWAIAIPCQSVPGSTGQYWTITTPCKPILGSSGHCHTMTISTGQYLAVLGSTGPLPLHGNQYWGVLGHYH